jgi:hypothetical protein
MVLLVTSAPGANGAGHGKLLAFDEGGHALGPFSDDDRIVDPRGVGVKAPCSFSTAARTAFWHSTARVASWGTAAR